VQNYTKYLQHYMKHVQHYKCQIKQQCTNSVPIVKNSQTAKMTIGVPIVTCPPNTQSPLHSRYNMTQTSIAELHTYRVHGNDSNFFLLVAYLLLHCDAHTSINNIL